MKIGFLSNQLDNRGTGNALYNYAHYNEEILGNKSMIITRASGNHDIQATEKFRRRFGEITIIEYEDVKDVDAVYHIKSGHDDGTRSSIPYLVHAVFECQPHGDRYATISPWMSDRFEIPYVPHIVEVSNTNEDLRKELDIPEDAIVYGRYGGLDSFDINFVWETIHSYSEIYDNAYFLFMNTNKPADDYYNPNRMIFLESTVDDILKRKFINTCDAMIHARARGETFGIAVGEFAICGKPIITYQESPEKAHLQELGPFALLYTNSNSLVVQLQRVAAGPLVSWGYGQYTPDLVMTKFKEVFLS